MRSMRKDSARQRGFSLVELLLVIALIAILIGLTLPVLQEVRDDARDVASLSNLRQHGTVLQMYANDSDGYWPYFRSPEPAATDTRFFEQIWLWDHFLVTHGYYGLADEFQVFFNPSFRHPGRQPGRTSYLYASTHLTSSAYWSTDTRSGRDQFRAVRVGDVTYPSDKAVLVEWHPVHSLPTYSRSDLGPPEGQFAFAMSDGSARREPGSALLPAVREGDWHLEEGMMFMGTVGLHTVHGVRGRDIE